MIGIGRVWSSKIMGLSVLVVGLMVMPGLVESADAASVTIYWTAPGDDGSTGTATTYDVRYSTSPVTSGNWSSASLVPSEPSPAVAGSDESMTITGLLANTQYYIAIKTSDEAGNESTLSNVLAMTTADDVAPAAIADLSAAP
jgi:hypothetical protein